MARGKFKKIAEARRDLLERDGIVQEHEAQIRRLESHLRDAEEASQARDARNAETIRQLREDLANQTSHKVAELESRLAEANEHVAKLRSEAAVIHSRYITFMRRTLEAFAGNPGLTESAAFEVICILSGTPVHVAESVHSHTDEVNGKRRALAMGREKAARHAELMTRLRRMWPDPVSHPINDPSVRAWATA